MQVRENSKGDEGKNAGGFMNCKIRESNPRGRIQTIKILAQTVHTVKTHVKTPGIEYDYESQVVKVYQLFFNLICDRQSAT